jgi:putative serine protease PepD
VFSSVLSPWVALLALGGGTQFSPAEQKSWDHIQPALATLVRDGKTVGMAAMIGQNGIFLAHKSMVPGKAIRGLLSDNTSANLTLIASDGATQLVLLKADKWIKTAKPLAPVPKDPAGGELLMAALPSGPIRAQFVSGTRVGVQSNRVLPLSEVWFELPADQVLGAIIFSKTGQLVGFLAATLELPPNAAQGSRPRGSPGSGAGTELGTNSDPQAKSAGAGMQGPRDLTVAYAVSPAMVRRVVNSFRSGNKQVAHPSIGVFCVDMKDKTGAEVKSVTKDSPAWVAGIRPGDVIIAVEDQSIENQVTLARMIMNYQVGQEIKVKVRRATNVWVVPVRVGSQSPPAGNPQGAT